MNDEIVTKVRLDLSELDKDIVEAKAKGNGLIAEIEKKEIKIKGVNDLSKALKEIAVQSGQIDLSKVDKEIDNIVKDIPKLRELVSIFKESANQMDKNSQEFVQFNAIIKSVEKEISKLDKGLSDTAKTTKSATSEMRGLTNEVIKTGDVGSETFRKTAKSAGELKDKILDAREAIKAYSSDTFKLDAGVDILNQSVAAYQGITGAMVLFGAENEDVQRSIERLVAVQNLANSVQQAAQFITGQSAGKLALLDGWNKSVAASQAILTSVTGASTAATRQFSVALAATGIGAAVVAIGLLVANWEDVSNAISGTTREQNILNATFVEAAKSTEKLQEGIVKVGTNFELAKAGVISKEEALKTYNETLGKTYGTFTDYNEAESFFIKATPLMVEAAIARQSADILIKKAAEKNIELLTLREQKEGTLLERIAFGDKFAKTRLADKKIALSQELGLDQTRITTLTKNAYKLEDDLKKLATQSGASFGKKDNTVSKNEIESSKKIKEAKIADEKELNSERLKFNAAINEKELQDLADKNKAEKDSLEAGFAELDKIVQAQDKIKKEASDKEKARQQELIDKQKQAVNELLDFAQNGILLQIGLNPQDVSNVRRSVENFISVLDDQAKTTEEKWAAGAMAAQAAYQTVSNAIFNADSQRRQEEMANLQTQRDEEIRLAGDNEQKKEIIRQKYALKEKDIKRKQAEADKRKALFDATVNTAVATITGFVKGGPILAAIAAALGAAQIALIAATPIPKFAKGVVSFDGKGGLVKGEGTGTSDSNLAYLSKGESVIPAAPTSANLGLINELVNGDVDEYVNRHYVLPALKSQEIKAKEYYKSSQIEDENNLIARVSSHTLKSIHKEQRNTTDAIKRLDKKDFKW